jgi:hypothetical protein
VISHPFGAGIRRAVRGLRLLLDRLEFHVFGVDPEPHLSGLEPSDDAHAPADLEGFGARLPTPAHACPSLPDARTVTRIAPADVLTLMMTRMTPAPSAISTTSPSTNTLFKLFIFCLFPVDCRPYTGP